MISIKIGNRDWINLFCNNYHILPDSASLQEHVDQPRLVGLIYYHYWFPQYILEIFSKKVIKLMIISPVQLGRRLF